MKGAAKFWGQVSAVIVASYGILSAAFGLFSVVQAYRWLLNGFQDHFAQDAIVFFAVFIMGIAMMVMGFLAFRRTKRSPE